MSDLFHTFLNHYADVAWIPLSLAVVHRGQRLKAVAFILTCMLVMRLQIEIAQSFGFDKGITGLLDLSLYHRGLIIYGFFIGLFLVLSTLSPMTRGPVYLAACLSIFFMAFISYFVVMVI